MNLANEIIESLSSGASTLSDALVKAQVMAHRLGEADMKSWVTGELRGYEIGTELPPYRLLHLTLQGDLSNGFVRYRSQTLPTQFTDKRIRDRLDTRRVIESIAVIEQWAIKKDELQYVIAPEFYPHLKKGIASTFEIERAWGKFSSGAMLQILSEVRSRLLDIALQIADRIPQEPGSGGAKELGQGAAVSEIFRNAVFGSNTTIVVGSGSISRVENSVQVNDIEALVRLLREHGLTDSDLQELRASVEEDAIAPEKTTEGVGPRVKEWMKKMTSKAVDGSWNVGLGAAGTLLASAIQAYYGLPH